jgi:large subunit ribosomal protein L21
VKEQFMYAVIETGGKQYRVQTGDVLDVERPSSDIQGDQAITFDRVLFVGGGKSVQVGAPVVSGVTVKASVVSEVRGPKVLIFKKKKRKGFRRLNGHRQDLVRVRIEAING